MNHLGRLNTPTSLFEIKLFHDSFGHVLSQITGSSAVKFHFLCLHVARLKNQTPVRSVKKSPLSLIFKITLRGRNSRPVQKALKCNHNFLNYQQLSVITNTVGTVNNLQGFRGHHSLCQAIQRIARCQNYQMTEMWAWHLLFSLFSSCESP